MVRKIIGWVLIIGGLLLGLASLLADRIWWLGTYPGINWAQIVGMVAGLVGLVVGLFVLTPKKHKAK